MQFQITLIFIQPFLKLIFTFHFPIAGSAICAFKLSDIEQAFEVGPFKNQQSTNSNWLPTSKSQIPEPRPGLCHKNTPNLPEANLNFIKRHSLMDWAVKSATPSPIFIQTSMGERLTVIAADQGVRSVGLHKIYSYVLHTPPLCSVTH